MVRRFLIAASALVLALPLGAQQQDNPPSAPPPAQKKDQQKPPKKSAAQQNPFPQEQSEKAAQKDQTPSAPQPSPQEQQPQHKPSTADKNPFPEEQSEKAARQAQQEQNNAAPPPKATTGQDYSSSQSGLKDLAPAEGDSRTADGGGGTVLSPDLAKKDAKVGNFYLHTGNFQGAYDRFLEATKVDPANAEAVFGLAEAARHLNRRDEALRNYRLYLSALPDGPRAKDVRKALKEMGASPNS